MAHWTPHNRGGETCRFCRDHKAPLMLRNRDDVQDFLACFDARFPPLHTRLSGILLALDRAARNAA